MSPSHRPLKITAFTRDLVDGIVRAVLSVIFFILLFIRPLIHNGLAVIAGCAMLTTVVLCFMHPFPAHMQYMMGGLAVASLVLRWGYDSILHALSPRPLFLTV